VGHLAHTRILEKLNATEQLSGFNATKGLASFQPDDGGKTVSAHQRLERARMGSLNEGQKLSYESKLDSMRGKTSAEKPSRHVRRAACEIFPRMYRDLQIGHLPGDMKSKPAG